MKVDVVFRGFLADVNLQFITLLLEKSEECYFSSPEYNLDVDLVAILDVIEKSSYVDFYIVSTEVVISEIHVPNVFANIGVDNGKVEILFFLDVQYLSSDFKTSLNLLNQWMKQFSTKFGFKYFRCQMDNGNEEEYYFDSNGYGPLGNGLR